MFAYQVVKLSAARTESEKLAEKLAEVHKTISRYKDVNGQRLHAASPPQGVDFSLREAVGTAEQAVRAFRRLPLKKRSLVSDWAFDNVLEAVPKIRESIDQIDSKLADSATHEGGVVISDGMTLIDSGTSQIISAFSDPAKKLRAATATLIDGVSGLAGATHLETADDAAAERDSIQDDQSAIASILADTQANSREAEDLLPGLRSAAHNVEEMSSRSSEVVEQLKKLITDASERLEQLEADIKASANKAAESAGGATVRVQDLSVLKAQAEEATNSIQSFAANLDKTKSRVNSVVNRAQATTSEFEALRERVQELIVQADGMVSGATVAGLAQAFGDERSDLDKSMRGAMVQFFFGIALLMLSTGLLAAYVFNFPLMVGKLNLSNPSGGKYELTAAGIFARAIIILAPFWLTRFAASRYKSLFDLRQQYSHKYNMAFSVEGFKRQAPSYAETISAWVFTIVAANPLLGKAGRPMDEVPTTTIQELTAQLFDQMKLVFKPGHSDSAG